MHHKARAFRIEAVPQHRRDELNLLSVVLGDCPGRPVVSAGTDMVDADA
jgi:hypothetical protein